jgi:fermentation-respiration switch protein FrsA (DUF1100 family)
VTRQAFTAWLLGTPLAAYAGLLAALYASQRSMVFQPDGVRPDIADAAVPGLRAVQIMTADGLPLLAWHRPAPVGQPTLAYFHGNGGSIADRIPRIRRFAAAGWGLLFLDYRGFGGNPGAPSEQGFYADARGAMAFLRAAGAGPIVVYGESVGTGVAVRIASQQPVAALLLESPYTSVAAIAQERFWFVPVRWLSRDPFDLLPLMRDVHAPVLIMQGARDGIVPPAMGRAVFAAAHEPKQFWSAPEGDHFDLMDHGAAEAAVMFVKQHVPGA